MAKQNSVIIDPGHGGSDPGAVYGNRREKDDTLALSYDIGNALERRGVRVEYTRVGDVYNSPYEKAQIGNSSTADLFLSIHRNAMAVPGVLCCHHGPFAWGKDAAEAVHNAVVMETVAEMAFHCEQLGKAAGTISRAQLDKHYFRKHGENAYYGQERSR